MEFIRHLLDIFLHLDIYLIAWAAWLGPWLYVALFLIVFCETGLVVTPFLPGDSLLFAVGALASVDNSPMSMPMLVSVLWAGAVIGDAVNYSFGFWMGPKVFRSDSSRIFNKRHLVHTQRFYEKYGGKTIILARFMPIVRTFAPFVAGIGKMGYPRFALFNVLGGGAWVIAFLLGGYFFGTVPVVKRNFHVVIVAIVVISMMPPIIEFLRSRRERIAASAAPAAD